MLSLTNLSCKCCISPDRTGWRQGDGRSSSTHDAFRFHPFPYRACPGTGFLAGAGEAERLGGLLGEPPGLGEPLLSTVGRRVGTAPGPGPDRGPTAATLPAAEVTELKEFALPTGGVPERGDAAPCHWRTPAGEAERAGPPYGEAGRGTGELRPYAAGAGDVWGWKATYGPGELRPLFATGDIGRGDIARGPGGEPGGGGPKGGDPPVTAVGEGAPPCFGRQPGGGGLRI